MASVKLVAEQTDENNANWGHSVRTMPDDGTEIRWYWRTPMVGWNAHLIKVTDLAGDILKFRGVDLGNIGRDFGPDPDDARIDYVVDLREVRDVYRLRPSSLDEYVPGSAACYAILLLSSYFLKGDDIHGHYPHTTPRDPHDRLAAARPANPMDGPKYPASSGALTPEQVEQLLVAAKERYDNVITSVKGLFFDLGVVQNDKVAAWLDKWAP